MIITIQISWVQSFGGISFLFGQILVSRKFVGDYHVRSAPPVTRAIIGSRVKSYPMIVY